MSGFISIGAPYGSAWKSIKWIPKWLPTNISGLMLWTKADRGITLNSSKVSTWRDQSGNGNHLTALAANQPTFLPSDINLGNGSSLVFSGSQKMNTAALTITQPNTIIVVGRITTLSGNPGIIDDAVSRQIGYLAGGTTYAMDAGATATGGATDTNRHTWAFIFNGASSKLYIDTTSSAVVSGNAGAGSGTGGFIIGTQSSGFMTGEIAEVMVYSKVLTSVELDQVFAYTSGVRSVWTPPNSLTFDGNSIMVGSFATAGFASLVAAKFPTANILNDAFSGYTTPQCDAQAAIGTDPQFSSLRAKNVNVMLEVINDYQVGSTAAQCITNLTTYVTHRHAVGWKVVMCTVLPTNVMLEVDRAIVNAAILAGTTGADAVADIGNTATTMGNHANITNSTYYVDQTHPTTFGHTLLEPIVTAAISPLL